MKITKLLETALECALTGEDALKHTEYILESIESDDVLNELVGHPAWEVRFNLTKYASLVALLALERDENDIVRNAAVEKHADELVTLATVVYKNGLTRYKQVEA